MKKILLSLVAILMATTMSAQTIFSENFENVQLDPNTYVGQPPTGWVTYADNLTTHQQVSFLGNSWVIAGLQGGGQVAGSASATNQGQNCDRWLVTPQINVNIANAVLKFTVGGGGGDANPENLKIMVSTTDNQKASFTEAYTFMHVGSFREYVVDLSAYENQNIYIAFVNCGKSVYLMLDDISVGTSTLPALAMNINSVEMKSCAPLNQNVTVGGVVSGAGVGVITSFDAYYEVDGVASETKSFSNVSIAYNESFAFQFDETFTKSTMGSYNVEVVISNVNGNSDVTIAPKSASIMFYDESLTYYDRTILLEQFTGQDCGYCPGGAERIKQAIGNRDDVIWISHHAGYYPDEMTVPESEALTIFYGGGGTFAPAYMVDRTKFSTQDPGPVTGVDRQVSGIQNRLNTAAAVPSFGKVEIASVNFNEDNRELSINITGETHENYNPSGLRLSVYLLEDSIYAKQNGAGRIYHMNVMRKGITNVWGEPLTGHEINKTYTYTMPTKFKAHHCRVVAFLTDYNENFNNRMVINSAVTEYVAGPNVGINDVNNVAMNVYPNPATNYVKIDASSAIREVRIINTLGQEVYANSAVNAEEVTVNTQELSAGVYVVTIKTDEGLSTRRMTIAR